jgi:hypothetical protein
LVESEFDSESGSDSEAEIRSDSDSDFDPEAEADADADADSEAEVGRRWPLRRSHHESSARLAITVDMPSEKPDVIDFVRYT